MTEHGFVRSAFCALLLALAVRAEAGEGRWTPFGLGGGTLQSLAVDPAGVVYGVAGTAGLYRSADDGSSWTWRAFAMPVAERWSHVAVSQRDPRVLLATTQPGSVGAGGVHWSADGGLHWRTLVRKPGGFYTAVESGDGTLLAAAVVGNEIYRSADGGATWSLVLSPGVTTTPPQLAFDPLAPQTAFYGASPGLWRSVDAGLSWQRIGTLPGGQEVLGVGALAFPGRAPGLLLGLVLGRIFRSQDNGLTWEGGALANGSALAVDPSAPQTVYTAGSKVYVSRDGGDSTEEIAAQLPPGPAEQVFSLAVSPADPDTLFASVGGAGVAVSHDQGQHWSLSEQRGLSARQFRSGFFPARSGRLYEMPWLGGDGLFSSRDHGGTWIRLTSPGGVNALAEDAGSPAELWGAGDALFHSLDGGATWSRAQEIPTAVVVSPAPGVVLAGSCGVRRSTDHGRSWAMVVPCTVGGTGGLGFWRVTRLGAAPGWPGRAWVEIDTQNGGFVPDLVLFTEDSGRTWRTLRKGAPTGPHLVAASHGALYLVGRNALLRSHDAGAHWETGGPVLDGITGVAADAFDPSRVWIATLRSGVLHSTDGGETWTAVNTGLERQGRLAMLDVLAAPSQPSVVYGLPAAGGVFQLHFAE